MLVQGMTIPGFSYRFSAAIVRRPGLSVARGIRAFDRGPPELARFQAEHRDYIRALQRAGLQVTALDALEKHPDSVFIEDAALCLPEGVVLLRPGAPSRTGEAAALEAVLRDLGHAVTACDASGFLDGGDILATESGILVGLSGARTDADLNGWRPFWPTGGTR
jgi:dimethylargininase